MTNDWKETTLGQVAEIAKDQWRVGDEDQKYIGLEHINQGDLQINGFGYSSSLQSNKFYFRKGDALFGKLRPYFRKVWKASFDGVCSTDIWVIRAKKGYDQSFIFYFMANPVLVDKSTGASTGTRMPRADWNFLQNTIWNFPPLSEQKAIAGILSSFDDKIELLRRQNKTLETMAQTLFKEWFVHFKVEGKKLKMNSKTGLPEGWRMGRLGDFFPIITGKKDANYGSENGKYPFFTCSKKPIACDHYSFNGSALLLAGNGDFNLKYCEGKFEAYQRTYVLIPYEKKYLGFLYYSMQFFLEDITQGSRGSVINFITKGMIENFEIPCPDDTDTLDEMASIFYFILQRQSFNTSQIQTLSKLRDVLLPKLMKGEIRVQ